jgi:hypothetical protein
LEVRALPPEPMTAHQEPPGRVGRQPTSAGCLWVLMLTPVVIVAGLVIGSLAARGGDDGPTEASVRIGQGTADGQEWHVEAVRDVEGEICVFLYVDRQLQAAGACEPVPDRARFSDRMVVFGIAPREAARVRVGLSDGREVEIDTVGAGEVEGRFYVQEIDGDPELDVTGEIAVVEP